MIDLATGKRIAGLSILSRGSMRRGDAMRTMMHQGSSIPDWCTPMLAAEWPNSTQFEEYPSDTENYNDIYVTYPSQED